MYAKIYGTKPYDVSFAINFFDKTIMFPKCNCPYTESHRNCILIDFEKAFFIKNLVNFCCNVVA